MKIAALVAAKFQIDPILVLKSSFREWAIRIASYRYVVAREEAEAKRSQAQQNARSAARRF